MRGVVFLFLVCSTLGCRDEGRARFYGARARYEALLTKGVLPSDRAFDEVLSTLEHIPDGSVSKADATALAESIKRARAARPGRPLASETSTCAALAVQLGSAQGEAREKLVQAVKDCRKKEDAAIEAEHHRYDDPDAGLN